MPSRSDSLSRLGCGYVLATVLITCVLLVLNGLIVSNVYQTAAGGLPEIFRDRRWAQAIVFLGPVFLLVIQWWAYDVAVDWLWPRRQKAKQAESGRRL